MYQTIIIIDDSQLDRTIAEKVIRQNLSGTDIICFSSAIDALAQLESTVNTLGVSPIMLFLDIQMPLMDGFEFLDQFSRLPENIKKHFHIVMLSSAIIAKNIETLESYPFVRGFIEKPLSNEKLEKFI